jgi:adenine phosphoribosyltransferase
MIAMNDYTVSINGLLRHLPVVPIAPGIKAAFLKLYGDPELTEASADALAPKINDNVEMIVGPESGGILLAHLLSLRTSKPYLLARKKHRPNMIDPEVIDVTSIGTPGAQKLYIDDLDKARLRGKRVALVDEVISTGATIRALEELVTRCGGDVIQKVTIATEGDDDPTITKLLHLPLFFEE